MIDLNSIIGTMILAALAYISTEVWRVRSSLGDIREGMTSFRERLAVLETKAKVRKSA